MSELNIVDSSVELFSMDKKVITFQINHNNKQDISENNINASISSHQTIKLGKTSLIVTNLTSEYISLRTKTTKKKNYFVYPSYCNISPNSQQKLDFNYFVKEGEEVSNVGHKFKFEGFIISPEEKDQESKMLFNKYISQKIPVKAYKLKAYVEFIENEINIDNDGEPVNINHTNNVNNNINNEINNEISEKLHINNNILSNEEINNNENFLNLLCQSSKYFSIHFSDLEKICKICNKHIKESEIILILPCLHIYHKICVNNQLKINKKPCVECDLNIDYILLLLKNNYKKININKKIPNKISYEEIIKYCKINKFNEIQYNNDGYCLICLNKYKNEDNIIITSCKHICHEKCFKRYVFFYNNCFQCNFDFSELIK